jgi:hypothetical protein
MLEPTPDIIDDVRSADAYGDLFICVWCGKIIDDRFDECEEVFGGNMHVECAKDFAREWQFAPI